MEQKKDVFQELIPQIQNISTSLETMTPEEIQEIRDEARKLYQKTLPSDEAELLTNEKCLSTKLIPGTVKGHDGNPKEKAIDIRKLKSETGLITYDPGLANTATCKSAITYVDGDEGILRYRGINIEELVEKSNFRDVAHLLIFGKLPSNEEAEIWSNLFNKHSVVPTDIKEQINKYSTMGHPMDIASSTINNLNIFYPRPDEKGKKEDFVEVAARLISKIRSIAALSYRAWLRIDPVDPDPNLPFCENFLRMMFHSPVDPYANDPDKVKALQHFWLLHADHEQNLSTSTVRMVSSGKANIYSSISSGNCALWGPLHGGANEKVIELLSEMHEKGLSPEEIIKSIKDKKTEAEIFGKGNKEDPYKLPGFGHKIYKTYDPRARILKNDSHKLCKKSQDPLFDIALSLEEHALNDDYFKSHNLYPNVDFYSGLTLKAIGVPTKMFTLMFACGRMPGWIAHFKEQQENPESGLVRPKQIYQGAEQRSFPS